MPGSPSCADVEDQHYNEVELPSSIEIRESSVSAGQPGAFSKTLIRKNTRFGPYKGEIIKPGQKADIDYRYAWEIFEKRRNVLKFTISASDPKASNWMRNVNCARFYEEQNIVSTQEGFSIFYVAMKDIKPGEELLTWFDPQLLKRTQRRVSRGERKKVGYTIELVPWTDEKKFVPEIIETKRARKKKVLGEDMLCFEEDAALMQKSLNSMFRIPRKTEPNIQIRKDNMQTHSALTTQQSFGHNKNTITKSSHGHVSEQKANVKSVNTTPVTYVSKVIQPKQFLNAPKENREKVVSLLSKPPEKNEKKEIEPVRKRKKRSRTKPRIEGHGRKFVDRFPDNRNGLESSVGYTPNNPSLLKPVVIRTNENGIIEMEDHDETYNILWSPVRQECDEMCQCMDKQGLLKQGAEASSSVHKDSHDLVVQFALLPEHQTVSGNNKVIYKCDICECSYNHAFSLKRHYLGIHINHRYISKHDAEFCQLETFHNGPNIEFSKDSDGAVNGTHSVEKVVISENCSELRQISNDNLCTSGNVVSSHSSTHNLLCNEAAFDSSEDDCKVEIPTLLSLARAQCKKNNSSQLYLSFENQHLLKNDSEINQHSIQRLPQNAASSMVKNPSVTRIDCEAEQMKSISSNELILKNECDISETNQKLVGVNDISMKVVDSKESDVMEVSKSRTFADSPKHISDVSNASQSIDKEDGPQCCALKIGSFQKNNKAEGECESNEFCEISVKMNNKEKEEEISANIDNERKRLADGNENISNVLNQIRKDVVSDTQVMQRDGSVPESGKLSTEENDTKRLDCSETIEKFGDTNAVEENSYSSEKVLDKEKVSPCEEVSQMVESNIAKSVEGKLSVQKLTSTQSVLPRLETNMTSTTNVKSSQSQQFLLLVPIGTPSSKTPSLGKSTSPCSLNLPQSQGNLPVVVLSSHDSSTTTRMRIHSSKLNLQPSENLTSASPSSSTPGQRITFVSHTPHNLVKKAQLSNICNTESQAVITTATLSGQKPKHASALSSSNSAGDTLKQQIEETDQPGDLYRCHMCVLVYQTMGELKHHIKNDPHRFKGGIKQYACPKCSVRFRNKANLARHSLMHHQTNDDKDRKFRCSTCGKGFTSETYLKMHARFHSGKSFPCKYGCVDAFFPNAGSLVKHLRAVHPGLNLKEYLREKKRRERIKPHSNLKTSSQVSSRSSEYSMHCPGVGFQAKRGRPKGSKNAPKELKELKDEKRDIVLGFEKEQMQSIDSTSEKLTHTELYPPVKKYYPIEKTWQKGNSFFKISTDANYQFAPRRFACKLCNAAFKSHLFLLKHRSKRHGAGQSVQEYLFEMAKDKESESCPVSEETLQFSPPPSPKTFFSNINQRSAENMSQYIEGSEEMLKCRKKLCFNEDSIYPFSSSPQLEWTHYNFPPCFRYIRDNTLFYNGVRHIESTPKIENCDRPQAPFLVGSSDLANSDESSSSLKIEKHIKNVEEVSHLEIQSKEVRDICTESTNKAMNKAADILKHKEASSASDCETEANTCNNPDVSNDIEPFTKETTSTSPEAYQDLSIGGDEGSPADSVMVQNMKDSNTFHLLANKCGRAAYDQSKGFKKFPRKGKEIEDMMLRLNKPSLKALNLETGARYSHRHLNISSFSLLDSLNLFSKNGNETLNHKCQRRKKRERYSSMSACSQLLPSKLFHRSRDQISCSIFSSPDVKEPRRCSMWQGPKESKAGWEDFDKFFCPVVESVRLREVSKKRKEIQEEKDKEVIDLKPKEKLKEDFATNMGLMSRREYERSYHSQEKEERCIKAPEIWERYDRIWFGKKGVITVVCSICHRHFSCLELCLRHQLKKHPHIEPSSLEMERNNYVEDMYYYYPMPYGILAQTHLIPEKMPPPELYVCTRCRFPFKNVNKLYSHIVVCDPNNGEQAVRNLSVPSERNESAVESVSSRVINKSIAYTVPSQSHISKPQRQQLLTNKYKNYQLFNKPVKTVHSDYPSTSGENKSLPRSSVSSFNSKPQNFMRTKNQHGLLYNPLNHTRRRELVHVLDQHQCHGCNLKFKSMSMLERHVKKCSGKDKLQNQKPLLSGVADELMVRKQHTCRYCNKRFTFIKGVDLHYKRICSVRKIREEENKLTEEDLAHEEELQRIIEHLKWSKSLNQDSSDIIQGRVKVEEDGTLTRVEKKRGRPFGKGKQLKKKGSKWTTLKYHRSEDNSSSSGEQIPSVEESLSNESLEEGEISKTFMHATSVQEITEKEQTAKDVPILGNPLQMPRKRGRPLKNGSNAQSRKPRQTNRKRGRPRKDDKDSDAPQVPVKIEMSLKDSIDFKRGELTKGNLVDVKREKLAKLNMELDSKMKKSMAAVSSLNGWLNENYTKPKPEASCTLGKPLKEEYDTAITVQRKRKPEEEASVIDSAVKPPARVRGRPKKFDPSEMESSYKKKKKTDPGYVPFVKRMSSDGFYTDADDSNAVSYTDRHSVNMKSESQDVVTPNDSVKKKGYEKEKIVPKEKTLHSKETLTSITETEHNGSSIYKAKSTSSIEALSENNSVNEQSEVFSKMSDNFNPVNKEIPNDNKKPDLKKRKPLTCSLEDSDVKKMKRTSSESQESAINDLLELPQTVSKQQPGIITSLSDGQTKETNLLVSQDGHVTATMASAFPNGDMVQTPVAVRIVALPLSSLATSVPSKIISPSPSTTVQPKSPSSPVVSSSTLMKLTITQSPQLHVTDKTLLSPEAAQSIALTSTTTTTSTSTPTAKSPNTYTQNIPLDKKAIPQSSSFPVRQIIPISNQSVLIPPEVIHRNVTPRFIIHSSPKIATQNKRPRDPVPVASTITRHVSPSTVILSTGKVVSLGSSTLHGNNVVRNPIVQHGASLVKKINVINPISNTSSPTQFLSSPPTVKKGMGVIVEPPKSTVLSGGSPAPTGKSVYYVQTAPMGSQVVMPISTVKAGVSVTSTNDNTDTFDSRDSKSSLNSVTVPQIQLIPVSLVQSGMRKTLHITPQPEANSAGAGDDVPNKQEKDES